MAAIKPVIIFLISLVIFAYTFYVLGQLIVFLSMPRNAPKYYTWVLNLLDNKSRLETSYGPIVFDCLYIILFIFQHSLMKSALIKRIWNNLGLEAAERSVYNLMSSLCLHYLIQNWIPASSIVLWQVDVESRAVLWWLFVLIHSVCWMVIYGGSIIMDLPEIMGIKQPYYDMSGYNSPMTYKCFELQQLCAHVRHPSFLGLGLILWCTNLMSLDRLLLAVMLTIYMYCAWSTSRADYTYQREQFKAKVTELKQQ